MQWIARQRRPQQQLADLDRSSAQPLRVEAQHVCAQRCQPKPSWPLWIVVARQLQRDSGPGGRRTGARLHERGKTGFEAALDSIHGPADEFERALMLAAAPQHLGEHEQGLHAEGSLLEEKLNLVRVVRELGCRELHPRPAVSGRRTDPERRRAVGARGSRHLSTALRARPLLVRCRCDEEEPPVVDEAALGSPAWHRGHAPGFAAGGGGGGRGGRRRGGDGRRRRRGIELRDGHDLATRIWV
mmetsp:Transcript_8566/g.21985  ORF Transcript_8566/g.21985 Transcript_8566/m.21985 type:complete len:243 (-) Transcript_8566:564-1292(-)